MHRVLEFYCGIGGLHYSVEAARPGNVEVVAAFDLNPVGNDVYEHNFGRRPVQKNLGSLSAAYLDSLKADIWLLSPPCQPFTRNGLKKDVGDGRALSFLHLLVNIGKLLHPPSYLLVENVVGFETSESRKELVSCLEANGYSWQEFILSPIQFGVPYSRPRYFMLAVRKPLSFKGTPSQTPWAHPPAALLGAASAAPVRQLSVFMEGVREGRGGGDAADGIWRDYAVPEAAILTSMGAVDVVHAGQSRANCFTKAYAKYCKGAGSILCRSEAEQAEFERARAAHIARRERERAALGAAAGAGPAAEAETDGAEGGEGSGDDDCERPRLGPAAASSAAGGDGRAESDDALAGPSAREVAGPGPPALGGEGGGGGDGDGEESFRLPPLRYFTEREVANLHGFPDSFTFPESVTRLQRYALLGNSLSVVVVAALLDYMLSEEPLSSSAAVTKEPPPVQQQQQQQVPQ